MPSRIDPALLEEAEEIRQLIRRVHAHVDRVRSERERESGLTRLQSQIIEALYGAPGLSLKDLTQTLQLSHSTVSEALSRLEEMEFVVRARDAVDARVTRHRLAPKVRRYIRNRIPAVMSSELAQRLARVSGAERQKIRAALVRLADLIESAPER